MVIDYRTIATVSVLLLTIFFLSLVLLTIDFGYSAFYNKEQKKSFYKFSLKIYQRFSVINIFLFGLTVIFAVINYFASLILLIIAIIFLGFSLYYVFSTIREFAEGSVVVTKSTLHE